LETSKEEPIIVVEDLTARFGENTILQDVSFKSGRSSHPRSKGCGKSTLLKHMIGLYEPSSGKVLIHGVDITQADQGQLRRVRMQFGVSFQSSAPRLHDAG
jgi:phospholipid/cholesterol/gamma-HCH transport system ATP-binding protein